MTISDIQNNDFDVHLTVYFHISKIVNFDIHNNYFRYLKYVLRVSKIVFLISGIIILDM